MGYHLLQLQTVVQTFSTQKCYFTFWCNNMTLSLNTLFTYNKLDSNANKINEKEETTETNDRQLPTVFDIKFPHFDNYH